MIKLISAITYLIFFSFKLSAQKNQILVDSAASYLTEISLKNFYDSSFFCKYSPVKKFDYFCSKDNGKIINARRLFDIEDKEKMTIFLWPEDTTPGWLIEKKRPEKFVRIYYSGDTNSLEIKAQLLGSFFLGKFKIEHLKKFEIDSKELIFLLKLKEDIYKANLNQRRKNLESIKDWEKQDVEREKIRNEKENPIFEVELPASPTRFPSQKWYSYQSDENLEKRIWGYNPEFNFMNKLDLLNKKGSYQEVFDIMKKMGLDSVKSLAGNSAESIWWDCNYHLGYFDKIVNENIKGNYVSDFFHAAIRSNRLEEYIKLMNPNYWDYEILIFKNESEKLKEYSRIAIENELTDSAFEHLKTEGEESMNLDYFGYHYLSVGDYSKAEYYFKKNKSFDYLAKVFMMAGKYNELDNLVTTHLKNVGSESTEAARFMSYGLIGKLLNGQTIDEQISDFELFLKNNNFNRDTEYDIFLIEGWVKNYSNSPIKIIDKILHIIEITKSAINVIARN